MKPSSSLDKIASPIRMDTPPVATPDMATASSPSSSSSSAHGTWLASRSGDKAKKKGHEYINLDYSGEMNVREPLWEDDTHTLSSSPRGLTGGVLPATESTVTVKPAPKLQLEASSPIIAQPKKPSPIPFKSMVPIVSAPPVSALAPKVPQQPTSAAPVNAPNTTHQAGAPPHQQSTSPNQAHTHMVTPAGNKGKGGHPPSAPKVKVPKPPLPSIPAPFALSPAAAAQGAISPGGSATISPTSSSSASTSPNVLSARPGVPPSAPKDPFQLNVKASAAPPSPSATVPPTGDKLLQKPALQVCPVPAAHKAISGAPMPSRGSCGSLLGMDASHGGSTISVSAMGERSKSNQFLSAQDAAVPGLGSHTASKTSLTSSELEINYATLDLASSREDTGCLGSGNSGAGAVAAGNKSRHGSGEDIEVPLRYAEIDFEKIDEQKQQQSQAASKEPKFSL